MIDHDRLDELGTWRPDDDTPDDAKIRIPAGDLRDLVRLIPIARAAMRVVRAITLDTAEPSRAVMDAVEQYNEDSK